MAGRDIPAATAIMKTTARHAGALWGSGGVVTVWSRVCVWVHVFLGPETALAYALPVWSAMADMVRSGGEQGETGRGLTVGVEGDRVALQWRFEAM